MRDIFKENKEITNASKQIALLKKHFPSAFDKEGKFIPHKIEELVNQSDIEFSNEAYSLNWLGKSYARLLANLNEETLLKEDKEHNQKPQNQNSKNLLIKGDNLEVLKHLTHAYAEKIKMIYIDPPYNTGSDGFVYNDDRKFTIEELCNLTNMEEDEARRILEFTEKQSSSHSAWLTFMYPRLYIARELLRDDGVIFISIDEHEQAQLKLLCDEVFGEENFINTIIWKRKGGNTSPDKTRLEVSHDYILMYRKASNFEMQFIYTTANSEEYIKSMFKYEDKKGKYRLSPLNAPKPRPTLVFDFMGYKPHPNGWSMTKDKLQTLYDQNKLVFPSKPEGRVNRKQYLAEWKGYSVNSIWTDISVIGASSGERTLFGTSQKPISLINRFLEMSSSKNSLILDFFAGSGTTAHAVMALNAEDGGNRKCISVQIDEPTDEKSEAYKAGYKTIFDITKARIEKAAMKIREENPNYDGDLGFKIFETTPIFENYLTEEEELNEQMVLFDGSSLSDEDLQNLLITWKTYDGIALHKDFMPVKLAHYTAYMVENNIYFMNKGFTTDDLKIFLQKLDDEPSFSPQRLIILGYNFESKSQKEINEAIINLKNKKSIHLDLDIRY